MAQANPNSVETSQDASAAETQGAQPDASAAAPSRPAESVDVWMNHMPASLGMRNNEARSLFDRMHGAGHQGAEAYNALDYFRANKDRILGGEVTAEQATQELTGLGMTEGAVQDAIAHFRANAGAARQRDTIQKTVIAQLKEIEHIAATDRRRFVADNLSEARAKLLRVLDDTIRG